MPNWIIPMINANKCFFMVAFFMKGIKNSIANNSLQKTMNSLGNPVRCAFIIPNDNEKQIVAIIR